MKYIKNTTDLDLELQFEGDFYVLKGGATELMKATVADKFTSTASWCVEVEAPVKDKKETPAKEVKEEKKEVEAPAKEDKEVK